MPLSLHLVRRTRWLVVLIALSCLAQTPEAVRLVPQLGHPMFILSVHFSPDARYVLTGGFDGSAILWDRESGRELRRFPHGGAFGTAFSPDGVFVLIAGEKSVGLWEVASGREIREFPQPDSVTAVEFSPDGRSFASGGGDHTLRLWDVENALRSADSRGTAAISGPSVSPATAPGCSPPAPTTLPGSGS